MSAATFDFIIEQGTTVNKHLVYSDASNAPIPMASWVARMQIRSKVTDANAIVSITNDAATTTTGTLITLDPADGSIDIHISDAVTTAFTFKKAVYDLELVDTVGTVLRLIEGQITLKPEVTRI